MKYSMYAILDVKANWLTPTMDTNDMTAKRNFKFACNNPESLMHFSPQDFALYRIGMYDNEKGELTGYDPVLLLRGDEVVPHE